MGAHPVRHRQGRVDPGQHKPGLSPVRARLRPEQGRLRRPCHRLAIQEQRLSRMLRELAPELATASPGNLHSSRLPALRLVITIGADAAPRHGPVRGCLWSRPRCRTAPPRCTRRRAAIRRPHQHPVHQRHDRLSKGRHAQPPQYPQQRLLSRAGNELLRARPGMHSGAALPLLRDGDRQSRLPGARVGDGLSERRLRSARDPGDGRGGALHGPLRRADDVHRRDGPPRFCEIRSILAAHRHHGRQPLPDRGHETGRHVDASLRDRHRLWHDRDEPGELRIGCRRPAGATGVDGRARDAACRGESRRRRGQDRPARHGGRIADARLSRHARLLERRGKDPRGDRRGGLDAYRRPRDDRSPTAIAISSAGSRTW